MVFGNGVKNIQAAAYNGARTVIGMRGDTFISLFILDQILSAEFYQKFPNFFGGEN